MKSAKLVKILGMLLISSFIFSLAYSQTKNDGNGIYRKEVDTSKIPPKVKFRIGNANAVQGEYLVILKSETPEDDVELIFKEFEIKFQIKLTDKESSIWKMSDLKGFGIYTDEKTAKAISEDDRVDCVTENVKSTPISTPPR